MIPKANGPYQRMIMLTALAALVRPSEMLKDLMAMLMEAEGQWWERQASILQGQANQQKELFDGLYATVTAMFEASRKRRSKVVNFPGGPNQAPGENDKTD